jgi:hypothetical protein
VTDTALQRLRHRASWIAIGALAGLGGGFAAAHALQPLYESVARVEFDAVGGGSNQSREVSEALGAIFRAPGVADSLENGASNVTVQTLVVTPANRNAVAITVQAYGPREAIQEVTDRAARRAAELAVAAGAARDREGSPPPDQSSGWRAIEREVAGHVPAPIRDTVRPWYEVALRPQRAGEPVAVGRRTVVGGLLIGIGSAIMAVFIESRIARTAVR